MNSKNADYDQFYMNGKLTEARRSLFYTVLDNAHKDRFDVLNEKLRLIGFEIKVLDS